MIFLLSNPGHCGRGLDGLVTIGDVKIVEDTHDETMLVCMIHACNAGEPLCIGKIRSDRRGEVKQKDRREL